jgi:uncharacterized protein YgiM (DUF1202 family)
MKSLLFVILLLFANLNLKAQQYYQVATETLNVRKSPSGKSAVISQFTLNDSVQVVSRGAKWTKIALDDGRFGYVASRFLSEELSEHSQETTPKSEGSHSSGSSDNSTYFFVVFGILAFLTYIFKGSSSKNKAPASSNKSKPSPSRSTAVSPKPAANEDITEVRPEANWYKVYNSDGKQLSLKPMAKYISLCGYSSKLILLDESNWYKLYDAKFHQIAIKPVLKGDRVLSVSLNTITIQEGAWIKTYDINLKQINVRAAR